MFKRNLIRLLVMVLILFMGFGLAASQWLLVDLPDLEEIDERLIMPSVRITDRNGRLLYDVIAAEDGRHTVLPPG